jgi:putative ABC transport system ATP-binding protein
MEVAKVENVTRVYTIGKIETQALRGVSLTIERGEFTALVGPSGSGKTTLLQLLGCLDQPTSGKVFIDGRDVSGLSRNERADLRRDKLGFVFQFFALIPTLTAYENVELPLLLGGNGTSARAGRVDQLLAAVGLSDRAHHRPDQLSGGEQQRVAVARALASRPSIVFADEPTGNLDSSSGAELLQFMRDAVDRFGQTIVMVTHDPGAASYADRVVFVADGRIVGEMRDPTADSVLDQMKRLGG